MQLYCVCITLLYCSLGVYMLSLYLLQFLDGPVAIAAKQTTPKLSDTPTLLV